MGKRPQVIELQVSSIRVPIKVYREYRNNIRASIGKKHAILRLPRFLRKNQERDYLNWMQNWLEKQFEKNRSFKTRFIQKTYKDGQLIRLNDRIYQLQVFKENRKTLTAKSEGNLLQVKVNRNLPEDIWQAKIPNLISRAVAIDYRAKVEARVRYLNAMHFKKEVKTVRLKYNTSNWGSCSQTGNINLSTRILFAPQWVQDYVIIHELAHLEEMNHSHAYWALVQKALPTYKKAIHWLRENSYRCYF